MWINMYTGRKLMIEILVAEDDEMIANLIKINLVKAGYLCTCAYNGKDAANLLDSKHFDLCLFDIMLPEIDGYELLEYAKSMDIPSIFITAMGTTDNKVKGLRAGADDYIAKPFEVVEMLARVESVLRRYKKTNDELVEDDLEVELADDESASVALHFVNAQKDTGFHEKDQQMTQIVVGISEIVRLDFACDLE